MRLESLTKSRRLATRFGFYPDCWAPESASPQQGNRRHTSTCFCSPREKKRNALHWLTANFPKQAARLLPGPFATLGGEPRAPPFNFVCSEWTFFRVVDEVWGVDVCGMSARRRTAGMEMKAWRAAAVAVVFVCLFVSAPSFAEVAPRYKTSRQVDSVDLLRTSGCKQRLNAPSSVSESSWSSHAHLEHWRCALSTLSTKQPTVKLNIYIYFF